MRLPHTGLAVATILATAVTLPARAAVQLRPGQEFLYTGTVVMKQTATGRPELTIAGPAQFSAVVTEADSSRGYAVILMRHFEMAKKTGQPDFPSDAAVATLKFGADLTHIGPSGGPGSPMSAVLQALRVPLAPRAELKVGDEWRRSESLPFLPPPSMEMVSTVTGQTKVADRTCLKIETKTVQALPIRREAGEGSLELTEYRQTLCTDPATGLVISDQLVQRASLTAGAHRATLDLTAQVTLARSSC